MNALLGVVLVLSLLIIIYLGPEYLQTLRKGARSYKKVASQRRLLGRDAQA
ncbi:hypothetical protein METEAL_38710 [Mesoterricola silvestris]|uniref:Uncharacterized protein n=1 Tax=Mesoterricola silvestris TaxID=2927979 RepID=A0AA48GNK7_9BACT|nr:hypothetical protein METEAL_38710 [Mesoterricola silvestris]